MELDDATPRPGDVLTAVLRQDLDPLSVADLEERIAALEGEIMRTKARLERTVNHRASADAIFRR